MATMRQPLSFDGVHNFLDTLFGDDLHTKRVKSLAGATLGAIQSASLAVGLIGQGLALARGRLTKHAVKQVDRLLSNQGIDVDALLGHWVPYVVGKRDITVAMDWTEFDANGQATIMLSLLSRHGRATPLVWLTVDKAALKNRRNGYEYQVLVRLAEILPADVRVRVVADRGFGDHKLYRVRSASQDQHDQAAHSFAVPSGEHALRTHAEHDRFPPAATLERFAQSSPPNPSSQKCSVPSGNEGS